MTHISVLVIDDDPEAALTPFDENIEVAPYPRPFSETDLKYFKKKYQVDDPQKLLERHCEALAEYCGVKSDEVLINDSGALAYMTRYNPKSQWDWYVLGGRWPGLLVPKPGSKSILAYARSPHGTQYGQFGGQYPNVELPGGQDQCLAGDLDWEAMKLWNMQLANAHWNEYQTDPEKKRRAWHLPETRNEYLLECGCPLYVYAVVSNRTWYGKGDVYWFGITNDTISHKAWTEKVKQLIDATPRDRLLSIYDLHI